MNFTQYLAGGGGAAPTGVIEDGSLVCFEDGTCVPGQGRPIGPPIVQGRVGRGAPAMGDQTGGPTFFSGGYRVTPQETQRETDPRAGMAFARLLDLMRNPPKRRVDRREGAVK